MNTQTLTEECGTTRVATTKIGCNGRNEQRVGCSHVEFCKQCQLSERTVKCQKHGKEAKEKTQYNNNNCIREFFPKQREQFEAGNGSCWGAGDRGFLKAETNRSSAAKKSPSTATAFAWAAASRNHGWQSDYCGVTFPQAAIALNNERHKRTNRISAMTSFPTLSGILWTPQRK